MSTYDEIRATLTSPGCSEEQFNELVCSDCGGPLKLSVHPDMRQFAVRCASDPTHVGFHAENDAAPEWWKTHVRSVWY